VDINRLVNGFLGSASSADIAGKAKAATSNFPGGLAGGAAAGGLVALMLGTKKGRKIGGKVLTYGGMAALGGLAYKAYSDYQANRQAAPQAPMTAPPPPPADARFLPEDVVDVQGRDLRLSLICAMISAAKADGHIDADEQARIGEQIEAADLAADEKGFLFDQMRADSDPLTIAGLARDEAQSAELYLASALAIDTDTPDEVRYMQRLGDALRLPDALRDHLQAQADAAKAGA
jgi:uncharacterized membrane protein YebE (DUF533 family)